MNLRLCYAPRPTRAAHGLVVAAVLALSMASAPARALAKERVPPELPGIYDGVHPHWRDTVVISADGTYHRGNGDPGKWTFDGKTLTLKWDNWGAEPLVLQAAGRFSDHGFTLTKRPPPAWLFGEYDGAHPHWRDSLTIAADGTHRRGNGDPGRWSFDGRTLVLHWQNWGDEPVVLQSEGRFADHGFTLSKRGRAEETRTEPPLAQPAPVRPPPAAPPRDCGTGPDDPGCSMAKDGAMALDRTEFEGLLTALKAQQNEITRRQVAIGSLAKSVVTAKQFGQMMALFTNELNRMDLVRKRADRMVNPKHALVFAATFQNGINAKHYVEVINRLE